MGYRQLHINLQREAEAALADQKAPVN